MFGSFVVGAGFARYQWFPYKQLRAVKWRLFGSPRDMKVDPEYALEGEELLEALREGGYLLFFRHATKEADTTSGVFPQQNAFDFAGALTRARLSHPTFRGTLCLSERGFAESWMIGQVMRELEIPIGHVMSSPACRCVETAEHAFGRVDEVNPNLLYGYLFPKEDQPAVSENLRKLFTEAPRSGTNTVAVGHGGTLGSLDLKIRLAQSDAAIFKANDEGGLHYVGKMQLLKWVKLMERDPVEPQAT